VQDKELALTSMLEWVDVDVLPVKYGGTNTKPLCESRYEQEMANYVDSLNAKLN